MRLITLGGEEKCTWQDNIKIGLEIQDVGEDECVGCINSARLFRTYLLTHLINYLLNYLFTARSRFLLENQTGLQSVK